MLAAPSKTYKSKMGLKYPTMASLQLERVPWQAWHPFQLATPTSCCSAGRFLTAHLTLPVSFFFLSFRLFPFGTLMEDG
jgi:hypothetical protein